LDGQHKDKMTSKMDTEAIKDYIHELQLEQLNALGEFREQNTLALRDFREEWLVGHTVVVAKVETLTEKVAKQNGSVASITKWQAEHPMVCEVKAIVAFLMSEIVTLKNQITALQSGQDTDRRVHVAEQNTSAKWERWIRPLILSVLLTLGVLALEHGKDVVRALKVVP
jgi:hypothetical protein